MPKSPAEMEEAIIANLPAKTGRSLVDWITFIESEGPNEKKERAEWLKRAHGLGHFQADTILKRMETDASDYADENALMDGLFKGQDAHLRPVYESIQSKIHTLGDDVDAQVRKTYISFFRGKQFLVVKPVKGSLILGLALPGDFRAGRLQSAEKLGGSDRITFQIVINDGSDFDEEALGLVKEAYNRN